MYRVKYEQGKDIEHNRQRKTQYQAFLEKIGSNNCLVLCNFKKNLYDNLDIL